MKSIYFKHCNIEYAKDQPQYKTLNALKIESENGEVITCWKLSFREKLIILFTGKIWLSLLTFNKPLSPIFLTTNRKECYTHTDDSIKWYKRLLKIKK